ncbi:major facilitator superfamily domain-containing protein [Fomitopsis serialis]|uniref:major facilitator superfamily domain-containing protein n=1 Tax=Fomitopsis serialis TaxID=139415 RepID=UPI002007CEA8|nr:major facilitator superfamily domain-containing protein [Neoantrodia serialis]KAH9935706.1 major facilitator superfamily domain-containing protein [Neoantrodia serialis]
MAPELAAEQLELDMAEVRSDSSLDSDPLLPPEHRDRERVSPRPNALPKLQLAVVYFVKLVIPLASTQSMPYINVLVASLAKAEGAKTGYYSGLVGSARSIAHLVTIYLWGRLSDRHGRKPVVIVGTALTGFFTLLFGISQTFPTVLLTVFLIGIFSGTTGAIHSIVGELVDSTNEAIAFPLYDIVSAIGFAVGPLIGGTFSNPATEFGGPWFDTPFWRHSIAATALLLAIFVLEETLPGKRGARKGPIRIHPDEDLESPISPVRRQHTDPLFRPSRSASESCSPCPSSACSALQRRPRLRRGQLNTVFVLQAYTPVEDGGLPSPYVSFPSAPSQIGRALGIMGTVSIFLKLGMPYCLRRFGVLTVFRFCMRSWPFTFAAMALLSFVAKKVDGAEGVVTEWTAVSFVLFLSRIGCMAFSIIMILTKDHTPGTSSLGTSNGLAEFAQSLASVFSPPSSLFAFSSSRHILGGHFWVVVMVLISVVSGWFAEQMKRYRDD